MYPPKPHDLTIYDKQFDFEKNGFCPHQWEISVPQKNGINWGVVLSYLRSADFTVPGKFEERLSRLTKTVFDPQLVKEAILGFNPFFNIHKCFFDETLQKVSLSFKKLLNENRPSTAAKSVRRDMQMISTLLKSNILIVDLSEQTLNLVTPENGYFEDGAAITFFYRECKNEVGKHKGVTKRFTFSLSKDLCWELRREALKIILDSSEIREAAERETETLNEKKEKRVNLLIALLKKDLTREVSQLYDLPYTVAKLADAGFDTDPSIQDEEGFSAFYYALKSNDSNVLYLLHRYAANSCYESESTFRNPDPCIVSNFSKLKKVLTEDWTGSNDFKTFGVRAEQARFNYQDLQNFNDFLDLVTQGINKIREQRKGSSMEEAAKQKDIILLILEKYVSEKFFSVGRFDFNASEDELVENYTKHKTYYDNLDFTVALLFFDNIFLLKSVLKLPLGLYSGLESNFLLTAKTNQYFTQKKKRIEKVETQNVDFEPDFTDLPIITILERLNLRESIRNFSNILRGSKFGKEDIVSCIPDEEIDALLSNCPELKDEFLVFRLKHYLRAALQTEPRYLNQKFVIQRALQVIGESINVKNSLVGDHLRECLPDDTSDALMKARNILSHLKSSQFPLKFETEEDDNLFESIQSEIREIKETFEKVFKIQETRLREFLKNRGMKSVQNFRQHSAVSEACPSFQKTVKDALAKDGPPVPAINEFCRRLMGFASREEEARIYDEVPPEIGTRLEAINRLEQDIRRGIAIDLDRFDCLFLKSKDLASIKKEYKKYSDTEDSKQEEKSKIEISLLHRIKKSPNPMNILRNILQKNKVSDSQLEVLYEAMQFSDETETTIKTLIEISKNPYGDNLSNLLNRIKHLHRISIDEQCEIRDLWERVKSSKAKEYLAYKIVQRHFREPPFQAALEMLLFDCVSILKNYEDFKDFLLKTSYLFNGIDVRNVLAHGDPLLESIGDILDPKDLPSELVKKMLQLFEDSESIGALCELWQKAKLKDQITRCERWQEYSKLLAENPTDSATYDGVIGFLNHKPQSKKRKGTN